MSRGAMNSGRNCTGPLRSTFFSEGSQGFSGRARQDNIRYAALFDSTSCTDAGKIELPLSPAHFRASKGPPSPPPFKSSAARTVRRQPPINSVVASRSSPLHEHTRRISLTQVTIALTPAIPFEITLA